MLDDLPGDGPDLLLEPMAGQGHMLCSAVADLGAYLDALDRHPRANVSLNSCHLFAAGHDLTGPDGVTKVLSELQAAAGPGRLRLIHAQRLQGSLRIAQGPA